MGVFTKMAVIEGPHERDMGVLDHDRGIRMHKKLLLIADCNAVWPVKIGSTTASLAGKWERNY